MDLKEVPKDNFLSNLRPADKNWHSEYLIMYSSWFNGYVTDPELMLIPWDDHLVHRGDGVFDVIRCVDCNIYQMEAHLKRLDRSAKTISRELLSLYGYIRKMIKDPFFAIINSCNYLPDALMKIEATKS